MIRQSDKFNRRSTVSKQGKVIQRGDKNFMAKKRKTLVNNLQEIIDRGDLNEFKAVFDKCGIDATNKGKTTSNVFTYRNLTPAHIQFLIDNGLDINTDCGCGYSALAFQAHNKDNLKCLIDNGADIDLVVIGYRGTALARAVSMIDAVGVKNLLEYGASVDIKCDLDEKSPLDATLAHCNNVNIIDAVEISKLLLAAGVMPTDKSKEYVCEIGKCFEFFRNDFNKDFVNEYSNALDELYKLFGVEPVPRRVIYDGKSKIKVKSTTWQKQHEELWDMLVPSRGSADTIQGEMIRIIGKVGYEILDNGGMNWDEEFRKMMKALILFLREENNLDSVLVEEACSLAKNVSSRSDKKELYRLNEIVVKWVLANPEPIKLNKVDYIR